MCTYNLPNKSTHKHCIYIFIIIKNVKNSRKKNNETPAKSEMARIMHTLSFPRAQTFGLKWKKIISCRKVCCCIYRSFYFFFSLCQSNDYWLLHKPSNVNINGDAAVAPHGQYVFNNCNPRANINNHQTCDVWWNWNVKTHTYTYTSLIQGEKYKCK